MMNEKSCGRKRSWPNLKYYGCICLEGPKKTKKSLTVKLVGDPAEIRTGLLPNTSHKRYRLSQPFRSRHKDALSTT
jgi:hypothetical protein